MHTWLIDLSKVESLKRIWLGWREGGRQFWLHILKLCRYLLFCFKKTNQAVFRWKQGSLSPIKTLINVSYCIVLSESCENILVQGAIWINLNISGCTKDLRKYLTFVTRSFCVNIDIVHAIAGVMALLCKQLGTRSYHERWQSHWKLFTVLRGIWRTLNRSYLISLALLW